MSSQTGSESYDINNLFKEAQKRWLKAAEVLFILENHDKYQLTNDPPQMPTSGSLYLFDKRVLKFFRRDGHSWRKKKDRRTLKESHERLKVGNTEALNCYYAHGEHNPNFQRRSYWMLEPAYEHIVLVHYREITEGKSSPGSAALLSPGSGKELSARSFSGFSPSPGSVEVSSEFVIEENGITSMAEFTGTSSNEVGQVLRRLEKQLSLNEDSIEEIEPLCCLDETTTSSEDSSKLYQHGKFAHEPEDVVGSQCYDGIVRAEQRNNLIMLQDSAVFQASKFRIPAYYPIMEAARTCSNYHSMFDEGQLDISIESGPSLTVAQQQKFTIREISPEWVYTTEATKVIIVGSFLCDPSESMWTCMFGESEVPVEIIQDGVLRCEAPPRLPGKVNICVTSGNRLSCSEIREFEYREKAGSSTNCNWSQTEVTKSPEELLLLVRFVQLLLSDSSLQKGDNVEKENHLLGNLKADNDSWSHVMESLLLGSGTSADTVDWLLQQLLKDKLQQWLSSKSQERQENNGCSLSKKEQGLIHMLAGLGFDWALNPILSLGVSIDFRDINGWTALHWAARFGREKMVAVLIASGASAGAVTDPNSLDPVGRTPAFIADNYGHGGLAGYLSELALTSHLSSLTLEESELFKGSAEVEAERTVDYISKAKLTATDDQVTLKETLAAVRNACQAAARIQSAFRAHSFRKRQQREAAASVSCVDEYSMKISEIQELSALSKMAFGSARDYNSAALSIQKKYRGWKGRKDFLALRQKVIKIQAYVRGYQVRRNYMLCWAVGILEKVVLRWRRKGVGLRGFWNETDFMDESEDEDILKVFRKLKVDKAIDEAVSRVLSMVESLEARQQYHRMLQRYRQAEAELGGTSDTALSTSAADVSDMENDSMYHFY